MIEKVVETWLQFITGERDISFAGTAMSGLGTRPSCRRILTSAARRWVM
jgi:hypothetical protein